VLRELKDEGLVEVAKPMGVVCAVLPCTNPIVTPMCNAMFAIKSANTIIVAPHPRAVGCTARIKELFDAEFDRLGCPRDVFLALPDASVEATQLLMNACDIVVATGGAAMVKSAYSSGRPSFGVGPGNVQGLYDTDIDIETAVPKAVASRIFDNGIICSADQTVIAPRATYRQIIDAFVKNGAYYTEDPAEVEVWRGAIFPGGVMNKYLVGQGVKQLAAAAGIAVPEGTRLIIVKAGQAGAGDVLSKEKMCPFMSAYAYDTWEEAVEIAKANLLFEGAGHSVSIQSNNREHQLYAGLHLPVSRVLVNQSCATMNGGAFQNSLSPTTTLGCGSWGNNSISENLSYKHFYNTQRIAFEKPSWRQPTDEEIWAE
jgi:succinate-semialdehyde dehydrogenase